MGVQKGWVVTEVGGVPYTAGVLRSFQEDNQPFTIRFTADKTLWQQAVARASRSSPRDPDGASYCSLCVTIFREPRVLPLTLSIALVLLLAGAAIYIYTQWAWADHSERFRLAN
jgi:hypothetical protein